MNRPRRQWHFRIWLVLLIVLPLLMTAAILKRQPVRPMDVLPDFGSHASSGDQP